MSAPSTVATTMEDELEDIPLTPRPQDLFDALLVYGNGEHEQINWADIPLQAGQHKDDPLLQMEMALRQILFPCGVPTTPERSAVEEQQDVYVSRHPTDTGFVVYFLQYSLRNDAVNLMFKNLGDNPASMLTVGEHVSIPGPVFVVKQPAINKKWPKMNPDDLWNVAHIMGLRYGDAPIREEGEGGKKRRCTIL